VASRSRVDGVSDDVDLSSPDAAFAVLSELIGAVFPDGPGDLGRVTWGEGADRSHDSHSPQERAERKLRAAEERFRSLVEQIPAVTFMAVLGEGDNEIYVSPHIEQLLGFTQTEWLENPFLWYGQLHPDDRTLWNQEFARGVRTGGPFKAECRFLARDGAIKWVHGEARLIKDSIGRPQYLQGIAFDITEQKLAQELTMRAAVQAAKADEQLAIARRVQMSILPRRLDIAGLRIAASMHPADDVGGDYYDVLPTANGVWITIGDVSGHGLDAGLIMMMLQSVIAAVTSSLPDVSASRLIQLVNVVLYDNIRRRMGYDDYVTLLVMHVDRAGTLTQSGSHLDILVRRRGGRIEALPTIGTWVGGKPVIEEQFEQTHRLDPGDVVVLYSDGVTESQNADGEQFGPTRLIAAIEAPDSDEPQVIHDEILRRVNGWTAQQDDDVTMLVFRYDGDRDDAKDDDGD
jgi:PAS domain S-box-containing protein